MTAIIRHSHRSPLTHWHLINEITVIIIITKFAAFYADRKKSYTKITAFVQK